MSNAERYADTRIIHNLMYSNLKALSLIDDLIEYLQDDLKDSATKISMCELVLIDLRKILSNDTFNEQSN